MRQEGEKRLCHSALITRNEEREFTDVLTDVAVFNGLDVFGLWQAVIQ
jgi:hypothetical protein